MALGAGTAPGVPLARPLNARHPAQAPGARPHIVLIMTDQHRADCVGCSGNEVIQTPHLDAIAAEGVRFANAFSSTPSCTPARAALLTGLSPWNHGMLGYGRVARKYRHELPGLLRGAGYYTFGIGKMHWYPQRSLHGFHGTLIDESGRVETEGFVSDYRKWFQEQAPGLDPDATGIGWNEHRAGTYLLAEDLHPTYWTGQTAADLIDNHDRDKPLFLKVSFARPHSPYDPPRRFRDLYGTEEIPAPSVGGWAKKYASFPRTKSAAFGDYGADHARASRRAYYGNVTFIDEQIGRIVGALKRRGMYDDALILFTADHGDMLGDHHHWRKTYAYQGSANIPMAMKWPGGIDAVPPPGSTLHQPAELRDCLPTFLDAAGARTPRGLDGLSLLDLVRRREASWRECIDMEHATCYREENYWCALTDGKRKYIYFFPKGEERLFDLVNDPHEKHDLAADRRRAEDVEQWRDKMIRHLSERGDRFVKKGKLQTRKKSILYSPHYPGD